MQWCFDRRGNDTGPAGGISIEICFRRSLSVETISVSFESYTVSSRASSWHRSAKGRRASRGETRVEDLLIDIDVDFFEDEVHVDLGTLRCSLRPRFPPLQAMADARTGTVDRGIKDTHL